MLILFQSHTLSMHNAVGDNGEDEPFINNKRSPAQADSGRSSNCLWRLAGKKTGRRHKITTLSTHAGRIFFIFLWVESKIQMSEMIRMWGTGSGLLLANCAFMCHPKCESSYKAPACYSRE